MATFDEAAQQACKVDGSGLIQWLDRFADESMAADFVNWDDTRRTSWPGGNGKPGKARCPGQLRRRPALHENPPQDMGASWIAPGS